MNKIAIQDKLAGLAWVVGVFVVIGVLWELAVKVFAIPLFILPPIEDIFAEFFASPSVFLRHAMFTVATALSGFFLAIVIGLALALAIVSSRLLERIFMTLLAVIHSIPKVALAPLFVIWLGTGFEPKIAIATLMCVLVIVVDTVGGMRSVDPEMISLAKVHHASGLSILFKIRLPHALPNLFSALKAAISLSVIGAIVGEYVGGQSGLGYIILVAQGSFDTPRAFAAVILLSVIATFMFYTVSWAETRFIPWHVSQRTRVTA